MMKVVTPFRSDRLTPKDHYSIGIHGIFGSFSHEAATGIFPKFLPKENYHFVELTHAENVFQHVCEGDTDIGICAFANSGSGGYVETLEAMSQRNFTFLSTIVMPLNMCLVTHTSVQSIDDITRFYGHPVALRQCEETLQRGYPHIPIEKATDAMDTALSAKMLNDGDLDPHTGVFCSQKVTAIYPNVKVFRDSMHHDPRNATFFIIFTK